MRTKEEILQKELFKAFPMGMLPNEYKNQPWYDAVSLAMDEWHKECLPSEWEVAEYCHPLEHSPSAFMQAREAIRWCRDFKREEKVEPLYTSGKFVVKLKALSGMDVTTYYMAAQKMAAKLGCRVQTNMNGRKELISKDTDLSYLINKF